MKVALPEASRENENLMLRGILAMAMILLAAALRVAPHPWNLTPLGAMALFSGAIIRDRRLAFFFPLLALLAGDWIIGFHILMPIVYASFLVNVAIGLVLRNRRTAWWIAAATLAGAVQFFVITNFGVWWLLGSYSQTPAGLLDCYIAGVPLFWNTLAGDALYGAVLFGGFALAERLSPRLRGSRLRGAVQPLA
jgi:hypothetical protein